MTDIRIESLDTNATYTVEIVSLWNSTYNRTETMTGEQLESFIVHLVRELSDNRRWIDSIEDDEELAELFDELEEA